MEVAAFHASAITPDYRRSMKSLVMALMVIGCSDVADENVPGTATKPTSPPKAATPAPTPAPPPDVAPTFDAKTEGSTFDTEAKKKIAVPAEKTAMQIVFDRCSKSHAVWKTGAKLDGNYVPKEYAKKHGPLVNVGVDFPDRKATSGNVLAYQVKFDKKGKALAIAANKDVSAEFCDLAAADEFYLFDVVPIAADDKVAMTGERAKRDDAAGALKRSAHLTALTKAIAEKGGDGGFDARGDNDTDAHYTGTCTQKVLDDLAARMRSSFKSLGFRRMTCDGGLTVNL